MKDKHRKRLRQLARAAEKVGRTPEQVYDLYMQCPESVDNFEKRLSDYGDARRAEVEAERERDGALRDIDDKLGEASAKKGDVLKEIGDKVGIYSKFS
jgi:hypothetical protein